MSAGAQEVPVSSVPTITSYVTAAEALSRTLSDVGGWLYTEGRLHQRSEPRKQVDEPWVALGDVAANVVTDLAKRFSR